MTVGRQIAFFSVILSLAACTTATSPVETAGAFPATTPLTVPPTSLPDQGEPSPGPGLVIGALLPVSGSGEPFGPAMTAAARVAVEEINAGGGVLDAEVVLIEVDAGDSRSGIVTQAVASLIDKGADVIVGPLSSGLSELVVDTIVGAGVIHFSPSNTSPIFTGFNDNGLYFRTAIPDTFEGRLLGRSLAEAGPEPTVVVYRNDVYGQAVSEEFRTTFEALGGTVTSMVSYPTDTTEPGRSVVADLFGVEDAVVVIGLEETAKVVSAMQDAEIGPNNQPVWVIEPAVERLGTLVDDPEELTGLLGITRRSSVEGQTELFGRMDEALGESLAIYSYGPETYDAVIITALAALIVGEDNPTAIAAAINDVTRTGTECVTFAECADLIATGTDIDYNGPGGRYEFSDTGEPTTGTYRVVEYTGEVEPDLGEILQAP